MLSIILLVFALVLFAVAGFINPPDSPWRSKLVCFGLACLAGADLVRTFPVHG